MMKVYWMRVYEYGVGRMIKNSFIEVNAPSLKFEVKD